MAGYPLTCTSARSYALRASGTVTAFAETPFDRPRQLPTAAFNRELPIRFKLAAFRLLSTTPLVCHPAVILKLSRALRDYFWFTVETVR